MRIERICQYCKGTFYCEASEVNRGRGKYCSLSCSGKVNRPRKNTKKNKVVCVVCGKSFRSTKVTTRFCSEKCNLTKKRQLQKGYEGSIVRFYKSLRSSPCEICGWQDGTRDLHHIISVSEGGKTTENNLICVCPNHHRMIHENSIDISIILEIVKNRITTEEQKVEHFGVEPKSQLI